MAVVMIQVHISKDSNAASSGSSSPSLVIRDPG